MDMGGSFGPPEEMGDFWRYCGPGEPVPSEQEVASELDRRLTRDDRV
jgi:hypothetical protein